jgi:hypothetical protein
VIRILICTEDQFKARQGIHLMQPDTWYLEDAINVAERDLFEVIYAHYPSKGRQFKIGTDALATLFRIAQTRGIPVDVADPAASEEYTERQLKRGAK